jgi:hypothetical protein
MTSQIDPSILRLTNDGSLVWMDHQHHCRSVPSLCLDLLKPDVLGDGEVLDELGPDVSGLGSLLLLCYSMVLFLALALSSTFKMTRSDGRAVRTSLLKKSWAGE